MEQPHMLHILYSQYDACWCPGGVWSHGISRHDIDPQSQNILSPASEELKPMIPKSLQITSMISVTKLLSSKHMAQTSKNVIINFWITES